MLAKLISEYDAVVVVYGDESQDVLEKKTLNATLETMRKKCAFDLHKEGFKSRHMIRISIQVHAEENPVQCKT